MLVWLDGRTNTKAQPQENFGREIMELFTVGVGNYTETGRLRRGARVHRLEPDASRHARPTARSTTRSSTTPNQHDTDREDVQLPDLSRRRQDDSGARRRRRACRTASISSTALAAHPNTARYLATKLYRFFVTEFGAVNVTFVNRVAVGLPAERRRHARR